MRIVEFCCVLLALNAALASGAGAADLKGSTRQFRLQRNSTKVFANPVQGLSARWYRNFRQPTFCPMVICHGTCASGTGVFGPSDLIFDEKGAVSVSPVTPCSLDELSSSCCGGAQADSHCGNQTAHDCGKP